MTHPRIRATLVAGLALWTGCLADDLPDGPDAGDAPPESRGTGEPTGFGVTRVKTPDGVRTLHYAIIDGHAIHGGDVDLGPVEDLPDPDARGGALVEVGDRWPNGEVRYYLDPELSTVTRDTVLAGLADLSDHTPLRFTRLSSPSGNYIRFLYGPVDAFYHGSSDSVGMDGGEQTIKFRMPSPDVLGSSSAVSVGTVVHEVVHAVGFFHEQARGDAGAYVVFDWDCIDDDREDQFATESGSLDLGPYDYESTMHYKSDKFCQTYGEDPPAGFAEDDCVCEPLGRHGMVKDDGVGGVIPGPKVIPTSFRPGPPTAISREDVLMIYRAYSRAIATDNAGDHFAAAIAAGDFDHDGYDDVAFGIPNADSAGFSDAGEVQVFRGGSGGLRPWQVLTSLTPNANDHYGSALTVGDFDGDGTDDLAVGAPDVDVLGTIDTGAVHVYRGQQTVLEYFTTHTELADGFSPVAGERFGHALASGYLGCGTAACLVIGAPKEVNSTRVGWLFTTRTSGAVFVVGPGVSRRVTELGLDTLENGDEFGSAIAVGDVSGDTLEDLVVGAPEGADGGPGAVYVFHGTGTTAVVTPGAQLLRSAGVANDRFGRAVAVGNLVGVVGGFNPEAEIAIGIPGANAGAGAVEVFTHSWSTGGYLRISNFVAADSPQQPRLQFGYALATADVVDDGHDDLLIGAPGALSNAGKVEVWRGAIGIVVHNHEVNQTDWSFGDNDAGDRFGETFAVGHFNGAGDSGSSDDLYGENRRIDVVVGAPGEAPNGLSPTDGPGGAGEAFVLFGDVNYEGTSAPNWKVRQSSK